MKKERYSIAFLIPGLVSVFLMTSYSQGQTNTPVIETPQVFQNDYHSVLVRWKAEPGAVYQVESADALESDGPQGLRWVIRESDCVSKGTNAEWMDVGDARWIPRVLHPMFQEHRFYRVQKVRQATNTPPDVSIELSQTNGVTQWFYVSVSVSIADTNQSLNSVALFVDGQRFSSLSSFPSTNFTVMMNSSEWPNGPHEIYAVASIADSAETTPANASEADPTNAVVYAVGVSPSQFVTFSNYISQYFVAIPFFEAGQTQEIVAKFEQDSYWSVLVVDYQDTVVRQFDGQGSSCYAAWDGNDAYGSPLPYGYYDYVIEARPSQYGALSLLSSSARAVSLPATASTVVSDSDPSSVFRRTPAAMQFSRTNCDIHENLIIPSLNPQPSTNTIGTSTNSGPPVLSSIPTSVEQALMNGLTTYFIQPPPMPPIRINQNGVWTSVPWSDVYGSQTIEVPIPLRTQEKFLQSLSARLNGFMPMQNEPQPQAWPDATYFTRYPTRIPGNLFFGYAGTVGIGFQGHHPQNPPAFGNPPGGVTSITQPPWGKINQAAALAVGFSTDMGLAGWRTSFFKANDNFKFSDLAPENGPGSGTSRFATNCNFGLVIGHMTASAYNDPDYYATVPYYAFYNSSQPGTYQWLALPGMDLGNGGSASKLRWMAFYGCDALRERDYNDLWTKFLIPMPPNLRLILGSEEGVFIDPRFGPLFADNLNGWTTQSGQPMAIFDAWCDAAGYSFTQESKKLKHIWPNNLGTRHMTAIYRDTTQGGSWNTLGDTIWSWSGDVSYDWYDVSFISRTVY